MKSYIPRPLYTKRIEPFIDKEVIKVITGQRRTGKSYILLQISDIIKEKIPEANIIFINKELVGFADIKNYIDLYQYITMAPCYWIPTIRAHSGLVLL